jgi:Fe-Mn family superoxide dismutase
MADLSRRELLKVAGTGAAIMALSPLAGFADERSAGYSLPPLPYAYDALEPTIDQETMHLHHDFHHKAYVDNLNKALKGHEELAGKPIQELLRNIDAVPESIRQTVRNNGGGHANHSMFWEIMGPGGGGKPSGTLAKALDETFGSFESFQDKLSKAATSQFGSGWGWLVLENGKLKIAGGPNQDSPYMKNQTPIMGIDVWEHAYYLKYRNRRPEYVKAWWNVANWGKVGERYERALQSG